MKNKIEYLEIKNCFGVEYAKIKFPQSLSENKCDVRSGNSSILGIYYQDYEYKDIIFKAIKLLKDVIEFKSINIGLHEKFIDKISLNRDAEINFSIIINDQTYLLRLKALTTTLSINFCVGYIRTKNYKYSAFSELPKNVESDILEFSKKIILIDYKYYHNIKEQIYATYIGNIVVSKDIDITVNEYDLVKYFEFIQQHGDGQLICNLTNTCLLNVLEDYNFRFETANPQNKFIKISKRGNSNLRDVYSRALRLGGLKESLIEKDWDPIDLLVEFDK